jgi:hypothetical protein
MHKDNQDGRRHRVAEIWEACAVKYMLLDKSVPICPQVRYAMVNKLQQQGLLDSP